MIIYGLLIGVAIGAALILAVQKFEHQTLSN